MTYDANNAYGAGADSTPGHGPAGGLGADLDGATSPDDLSRPLYGASFGQAVRRFLKKFTVFSGRASRSEYWWVALFIALLSVIPGILIGIGAGITAGSVASDPYATTMPEPSGPGVALVVVGYILLSLISLALIVPYLALTWRRLHDANFAGPFFFLAFVPFVGSLIVLVLTLMPSKPEGRRFDA